MADKNCSKSGVNSSAFVETRDSSKENLGPSSSILHNIPSLALNNGRNLRKAVHDRLYTPYKAVSASYDSLNVRNLPKHKEKEINESRLLRENLGKIIHTCKALDDGGILQK